MVKLKDIFDAVNKCVASVYYMKGVADELYLSSQFESGDLDDLNDAVADAIARWCAEVCAASARIDNLLSRAREIRARVGGEVETFEEAMPFFFEAVSLVHEAAISLAAAESRARWVRAAGFKTTE